MLCTECGNECLKTERVCRFCGTLLSPQPRSESGTEVSDSVTTFVQDTATDSASAAAAPAPSRPTLIAEIANVVGSPQDMPTQVPSIPYAALIGLLLITVVCSSAALFSFVLASKMHSDGILLLVAGQLTVGALVALLFSIKKCKQINSTSEHNRIRSLTIATVCIQVMFFGVGAGMGKRLGTRRAGYSALVRDWAHFKEVGNRISDRRNSVAQEIPAYLSMYHSIAADVTDLQTTTARLLEEEQHYLKAYPEYGPNAAKEINALRTTQQRVALLQQQILVAAKISSENEQNRALIWLNEMVPVQKQEDALDRGTTPVPK